MEATIVTDSQPFLEVYEDAQDCTSHVRSSRPSKYLQLHITITNTYSSSVCISTQ